MTVEMLMVEEKEASFKTGLEQGLEQKAIETAKNMKIAGINIQTISQCTGLSIEEIEKL